MGAGVLLIALVLGAADGQGFTVDTRTVPAPDASAPLAGDPPATLSPGDPGAPGAMLRDRQRSREMRPVDPLLGHPDSRHLFWENNSDYRRSNERR